MSDDTTKRDSLVITAPAGTKARWVRRAGGQKLGDWITQQCDKPANQMAGTGCERCGSVVLTYDEGDWLCALCGVVR